MRTALITGVVGQDGAYLSRRLIEAGYRVVGTRTPVAPPAGFVEAYLAGVHIRTVDLRDGPAMAHLLDAERPDEIYNLASISSVGASWDAPVDVAEVNGVAVLALLEAVRRLRDENGYDPRILQASSAEIFGTPTHLPQTESDPIRPTNPYGVAKAFAHQSAVNYRNAYGLQVSTVILFNHESPLRPPTFVTRKITRAAVEIASGQRDHLELGNLDIRRDWGSAREYATAMHRVQIHDVADDFIVASGASKSLRDFVEVAFRAAGVADPWPHIRSDPSLVRPTDVAETRGDIAKIEAEVGWHPSVSFTELVQGMVDADQERMRTGTEHSIRYLTP